jgi:4-hydroxybenzoate polyprenyltransferase
MITRVRLFIVVIRPAVLLILGMFALVALAQSGHGNDPFLLVRVLLVVVSFLVFSVAVNDMADEAIDRINLRGVTNRPLVIGSATRRELTVVAGVGACMALAGASLLTWPALIVTVCGLLTSAAYSIGPIRLANRGVVASLVLPACYVAVPFLVGSFSVQGSIGWHQLELLTGLYIGFIGRIVLKDFRDVKGDSLFGKRTFLVRYGRKSTVVFSGVFMAVGTTIISVIDGWSLTGVLLYFALLGPGLFVLWSLGHSADHRRDERLIATSAILGRGIVMILLMHLEMMGAGGKWTLPSAMIAGIFIILTIGQARSMIRFGPRAYVLVPWKMQSTAMHGRQGANIPPLDGARDGAPNRMSTGRFDGRTSGQIPEGAMSR